MHSLFLQNVIQCSTNIFLICCICGCLCCITGNHMFFYNPKSHFGEMHSSHFHSCFSCCIRVSWFQALGKTKKMLFLLFFSLTCSGLRGFSSCLSKLHVWLLERWYDCFVSFSTAFPRQMYCG